MIEYTSTTATSIGGDITRGVLPKSYPAGTPVYKYELGGVNLSRINRAHNLDAATVPNPITLDSYHIKLDMSQKYGNGNVNALGFSK